jgi:capsular exopolysaccharide synthesis family protein
MELSDYIRILRKNWLVIVVAALLGVAVAAGYSLTRTPQYSATSTVFVSTQSGETTAELAQGNTFTQSRITTYVNLIDQPYVLNPVIQELGLQTTADSLAGRVTASADLNSTLINVTATGSDPIAAADIANATASSLAEAVETLETRENQEESPLKLTRTRDASPALSPISPNVPLNLALGGLIGLALGIGIAVLRAVLDNKVRTPRDVENLTDRPLIGAIPFDPKAKERPLILEADPHNQRSEAFRSLRTNLQFLEMEGGHTFVVTSSVPSEGKSTTTINLAVALADAGKRVALLDTDLRKPKIAEYLNIEGGAGLTDVLIGRARVADVMFPWGKRPLYVLPAGKIPPNPSELLGSKQMGQLLEALANEFDIVLCDAPPLLPVTDAAVLSRSTTGALVIVAAGRTTNSQLGGAFDALETVGAKVGGVVLTMVPTRGPDSYGYGYGYGYGGYGVYGAPTKAEQKAAAKAERKAARASGRTRVTRDQEPKDPGPLSDIQL